MKEVERTWLDNAFWLEPNRKNKIRAILRIIDENGRKITQELTVAKTDNDGNSNPDFLELLEQVGEEKVNENTIERKTRKEREKNIEEEKKKAKEQARELERLFDAKIKTLEIDQIKSSKNRELKSKLRRAKNNIELQVYAQLIVMEELGYAVKKSD